MPAKSGKTGAKAKIAKTKAPKGSKKASKKGRKAGANRWTVYIGKVLKQVHSDTTISKKAMSIMNSFINDIFERLATEAGVSTTVLLWAYYYSDTVFVISFFDVA